MTPERIAWLVANDPIVSELHLMWRAWAWSDRGRSDPRRNLETEEDGGELEQRALEIVYGLRLEGWSTLQRGQILAMGANRAIWALQPAALGRFYEKVRDGRPQVRLVKLREVMRGLRDDWRSWKEARDGSRSAG